MDILIQQLEFQLLIILVSLLFHWSNDGDVTWRDTFWFWFCINICWYGTLLIYYFVLWKGGRFIS